MTQRIHLHGLDIAKELAELVAIDIAPGTGISPDAFWLSMSRALDEFMPRNAELLAIRDDFQVKINNYYKERLAQNLPPIDPADQQSFLTSIDYIQPQPGKVELNTQNVDPEIATIAGPQLVVPVMNARYALNAANARWGSLYDALYGTDVIPETDGAEKTPQYNPVRGQKVVAYAGGLLDEIIPLAQGSHQQAVAYKVQGGDSTSKSLVITLENGEITQLKTTDAFVGFKGDTQLLFKHNELHLELLFDATSPVGRHHPAGLKDVVMESAITTIQDCEDSVAAVDASDKVVVYRNWLGLMQGSLEDKFEKAGRLVHRSMAQDRFYTSVTGESLQLPGRSLMLVRNVGLLMNTQAVLKDGQPIPEGILDGFITAFAAVHDVKQLGSRQNSRQGSVYIVKPKMHGPDEVQFTVDLFAAIEKTLQLPANTLKIGIMDEERRTTLNLKACIERAAERVIFINTGFLDRTGDEIHTSMLAGPMVRKTEMKQQPWIAAYEDWNVNIGLACGLKGKAQIGKGMWPKPDLMADMLATKIEHPNAGANCAWVPSPTAASLHVIHYHRTLVADVQAKLANNAPMGLTDLLKVPVAANTNWSKAEINQELDNNAQGILGYVVRWVQHGVGCSKVPDIHDVGLMEDRATLRISSQHMANWLYHGVCSESEVMAVMRRMAQVVDRQNEGDTTYKPMCNDLEHNIAFKAACRLVIDGKAQPSGYTEVLLHKARLEYKESM